MYWWAKVAEPDGSHNVGVNTRNMRPSELALVERRIQYDAVNMTLRDKTLRHRDDVAEYRLKLHHLVCQRMGTRVQPGMQGLLQCPLLEEAGAECYTVCQQHVSCKVLCKPVKCADHNPARFYQRRGSHERRDNFSLTLPRSSNSMSIGIEWKRRASLI